MRKRIWVLPFFLLMTCLVSGSSFYFYEPFNTFAGKWQPNFHYGRSGVLLPTTAGQDFPGGTPHAGRTSTALLINNQLCMTGAVLSHWKLNPNELDWYDNYWVGNTCKLTNANNTRFFSASETEPFGYQVIRKFAHLDAQNETYVVANVYNESFIMANEGNIWLVVDNGMVSGNVEFESYDDTASMYEMFRCDVNSNSDYGGFRSQW
jgi:hypothetical protein